MPETIALIATFASAYASSTAAATAIFYGVQGALYAGLSIGLSLLSSLIYKPPTQKPEDGQVSIKQALQFRNRQYGRGKKSGAWIFAETDEGRLHKVIGVTQGPIDAIEEFNIGDVFVTLDINGNIVTGEPYDDGEGPRIKYNLGAFPETAFSDLISTFPLYWTSNHRGDGIVSIYIMQRPVKAEDFNGFYPQGAETLYRIVFRGVKVKNPHTNVVEWSENASAIIMDYMSHLEGMRLPSYLFETPIALAGWQAAFDRADLAIPKKAGGTEAAYRLWGSYSFDERPADVLGRMLASCDGRLQITSDGGITLDIGTWAEPTVILDEGAITAFQDFGRGRNILETANTINATYIDATHDFQTTDADPWINDADVSLRGEIASNVSFIMSPSHGQCRRLMKLEAYRRNPDWIATIICNLKGLAAFGERYVRVRYPQFNLDEVFEVKDFKLNIGDNNILNSVTIQIQSMPEEAYDWDAATEEGTAPVAEKSESDKTVPIPTNFSVIVDTKTSGGVEFPYAILSFDPAPNVSLTIEARGKRTIDSEWIVIPVSTDEGTVSAESFPLSDGEEYEFQIRFVTITGRVGDWTPSEEVDVLIDPVNPQTLVSFTAPSGVYTPGYAALRFVTKTDTHLSRVAIYKVATGGALDTNDPSQFVARLSAISNSTNNYVDGDNTVSNLVSNGDFALAGPPPTLGANWTIGSGTASKTSGGANAVTWTVSVTNATLYRMGIKVNSISGGTLTPGFTGTLTDNQAAISTSGTKLFSHTTVSSNTNYRLIGQTATVCNIDDVVLFIPTTGSLTQGVWDYYAVPENSSGLTATPSGPLTITVI